MESLDANENMCTFLYSCKKIKLKKKNVALPCHVVELH